LSPQILVNLGNVGVVLQILVEHGAQVDAKDWRGYSPAHLAISHGHSVTLRALIKAGAVIVVSLHTMISFLPSASAAWDMLMRAGV